jgi:hypothetical protein
MKAWLIQFDYDGWTPQRMKPYTTTVLVYAESYEQAVWKVKQDVRFDRARLFVNLTIP